MFVYKVYTPCKALSPFIYNYSMVENDSTVEHRILPRPAPMLGILFKGRMELRTAEGQALASNFQSGLLGIQDKNRVFYKDPGTGMLAVNFTTAGVAAFLRCSMDEIFNQGYTLDLFYKNSSIIKLQQRIVEASTAAGRVSVLESFLLSKLMPSRADALVQSGIQLIHQQEGVIKADLLARDLYITSGRLEKRFKKIIGTTPKKFAAMVRIQSILKKFKLNQSLTRIAYEAGYFDQPHFIHDFKSFTGYTPRQLLNKQIADHTALPPCGFVYDTSVVPVAGIP